MKSCSSITHFIAYFVFSILAIVLFSAADARADTRVWTGDGGDANLANPGNWSDGIAPNEGDAWEFGASANSGYNLTNNYGIGFYCSGITFTELATGSYTIAPNWTSQTGDIVNNSSYPQYVSLGHELHNSITINAANGDLTLSQNNTVNLNGNNLTIDGDHNTSISLYISNNGSIVKNGAGTLELYNGNYLGNVTINEGTLIARGKSIGDPGAQKTVLVNKGASIEFAAHDVWDHADYRSPAQIIVDGGTLFNDPGWFNTLNYLTLKNGGNIIDNSGHDTWLSYQLVGECNVIADSKLDPSQISTISIDTEGVYNGVIPNGVNFNVADVTQDNSTDFLISARLRNGPRTGNFVKTGAGTMELTAVNEITGAVTISEGVLKLSENGTLGYGPVNNNAALEFAHESEATVSNLITGTGTITKTGYGTVTLTQSPAVTGEFSVEAGTLNVDANGYPNSFMIGNGGYNGNTTGSFTLNNGTVNVQTRADNPDYFGSVQLGTNGGTGVLTINDGDMHVDGRIQWNAHYQRRLAFDWRSKQIYNRRRPCLRRLVVWIWK